MHTAVLGSKPRRETRAPRFTGCQTAGLLAYKRTRLVFHMFGRLAAFGLGLQVQGYIRGEWGPPPCLPLPCPTLPRLPAGPVPSPVHCFHCSLTPSATSMCACTPPPPPPFPPCSGRRHPRDATIRRCGIQHQLDCPLPTSTKSGVGYYLVLAGRSTGTVQVRPGC